MHAIILSYVSSQLLASVLLLLQSFVLPARINLTTVKAKNFQARLIANPRDGYAWMLMFYYNKCAINYTQLYPTVCKLCCPIPPHTDNSELSNSMVS